MSIFWVSYPVIGHFDRLTDLKSILPVGVDFAGLSCHRSLDRLTDGLRQVLEKKSRGNILPKVTSMGSETEEQRPKSSDRRAVTEVLCPSRPDAEPVEASKVTSPDCRSTAC